MKLACHYLPRGRKVVLYSSDDGTPYEFSAASGENYGTSKENRPVPAVQHLHELSGLRESPELFKLIRFRHYKHSVSRLLGRW